MTKLSMLVKIRQEIVGVRQRMSLAWRGGEIPRTITEELIRLDEMLEFLDSELELAIKEEMPRDQFS